jgi:hypothetical protein
MSAVPPDHSVDRDRPVHHRGTGAHDEHFSEAEHLNNTVDAGMLVGTMIAIGRDLCGRRNPIPRRAWLGLA